jgi:membrane associated rhomboid family serine protease
MLFPIWDDQVKWGATPYVTWLFIILNVGVFLYEVSLGANLDAFLLTRWAIPTEILAGRDLVTLLTSIFLHGGRMHLIGNMLFLWVFGDNIEARIWSVRFFLFYLLGGIVAGLVHAGFNPSSTIPAVGASGAIAAVLGAYLMMFPKGRIKMLFMRTMQSFYIPANQFLLYWIGLQFLSGIWSLTNLSGDGGVAWWAHIGGFVFGVVIVFTKILHRQES